MDEVRVMIQKWLCGLVGFLLIAGTARAQDVSVPDLTGLNVPQAAALLNRAGLRLGAENVAAWRPASVCCSPTARPAANSRPSPAM